MTTASGKRRAARTSRPQPRRATTGHGARQRGPRQQSASRGMSARLRTARRRRAAVMWLAAAAVLAGLVTAAVLTTGPRSSSAQDSAIRPAPGFTLTDTSGRAVSLASYRGRDVVLYFNEGAGCDACFYQMRDFEQHAAQLRKAGITILPIVMNTASQIRPELTAFGLHTPYLIDATGSVSRAYGALGKGMHAGLPGHGFVLIDGRGTQRWYGEYPSMYLPTTGLLQQVRAHLGT
ncbi:MAG: peroxiredoxin family protein [Micromonosporaceae bacterium]